MTPERAFPEPIDHWCIVFRSGAMRGRRIALRLGANAIGSDQASQVLLPDADVLAKHLVLTAGEVALTLQRIADAPVELNGQPMVAERRSLVVGDIVSVGRIDFQIERDYGEAMHPDAADSMFAGMEPPSAPVAPRPRGGKRALAAALALILLCAAAGAAVLWLGTEKPAEGFVAGADLARLHAALRDFPELEARAPDGAGVIRISGFVESQSRRDALVQTLRPFAQRIRIEAIAFDGVIDRARQFVADPGLAFSYRGKGRLLVSGATDLPDTRERVQRLSRDLYPLIVVEDSARYRAPAPPQVGAAAAGAAPWTAQLPAKVVGITRLPDGTRYVELANGDRYFEGAVLRSGAALGNLNPEELLPHIGDARAR